MRLRIAHIAVSGLAFVAAAASAAPPYPSQPIRIVVPLTQGSGADVAARVLARHLEDAFKQPVVVENRPGAGGQVGGQAVLNAPSDGHTLLVHSTSYAVNTVMFRNLPYDAARDFVDVALLGRSPYVMVTAAGGPFPNLRTLIDAAKHRPGVIAFASAGVGSSTHLTSEYFNLLAGVKMLHIPYKGTPEAIGDTMSGATAYYMAPLNTAVESVRGGKVVPLGLSTRQRAAVLPDVAPLAEQGLKDFDVSIWYGMWARAGTPPEVIRRINAQVNASLKGAELRRKYDELGMAIEPMSPEQFAKFVRGEIELYRRIVAQAGIAPQ